MLCELEDDGGPTEVTASAERATGSDELREGRDSDGAGMVVADGDTGGCAGSPSLEDQMLDHLSRSHGAHFKSQQIGEPELTATQKREIAQGVLQRSCAQFLARFGHFLQEGHLEYFRHDIGCRDDYEVQYHVGQLQRFLSKHKNRVDVKNRRYEALKKLVEEGSYFSDEAMRQRNPLLYERLVGRYLTAKEVEEHCEQTREGINSLVNLFLAQIEREQERNLRQRQVDAEEGAKEEFDTSDEDSEEEPSSGGEDDDDDNDGDDDGDDEVSPAKKRRGLSLREKQLMKQEFVTSMYQSFLDGKDVDFDYSKVDRNPEYDCLKVRTQDEEEKYFDCETPEDASVAAEDWMDDGEGGEGGSEDELDRFMKELKPEPTPTSLAADLSSTSLDKTQ